MSRRKAPPPPAAPPPEAESTPAAAHTRAGTEPREPGVADLPPADPAPADRVLLEDWTPLGQCLSQRVGRQFWLRHAGELFADDTVPHWVHDNGAMSQRTAQVLAAWCQDRADQGTLPAEIVLCEIGMGTGLHLRYLLDAFRSLCAERGTDWYGRLIALATDVSAQVARTAQERGLFAEHADHVRIGFCDVQAPDTFVELDSGVQLDLRGRVHVFVAYYVLDLLPMDVFRRRRLADGDRWEALWVRSWLRDAALLPSVCDASIEELQSLAAQERPETVEPIAQAWSLLQEELRAWPVALDNHPDCAALGRFADAQQAALGSHHPALETGTVVIHSAGALRAAQLLAQTVAEGGIVLLRDVGLHAPELAATARGLSHYGQVSAAAVNLVQFDQWLTDLGLRVVAPRQDGDRGQCSRLLARDRNVQAEQVFSELFDTESIFASHALLERAAAHTDAAEALEFIRQAIVREPTDWTLHLDAARVALDALRQPDVAHVIALRAVQLNSAYSPDLWCALGDALHAQGQADTARRAYGNALAIWPRHARSLWSLAYVEAERGRHGVAFELLGQALRHDRDGVWRPQILQLLDVCLRGQTVLRQAEVQRLAEQSAL
ncbi:MAG: tetratricopeptide repeat protein [Deltaproteobacteria bacterium]|nr:tetratricopeptide repeat protein [Deltaproteobacteria bacterium]